jgi:twitching motility protein PilT
MSTFADLQRQRAAAPPVAPAPPEARPPGGTGGGARLPLVDCSAAAVDPKAAALLPPGLVAELGALPVQFTPDGGVLVALSRPDDAVLERIAREVGLPAHGALPSRADDLRAAITALVGAGPTEPTGAMPPGPARALLGYEQAPTIDLDAILRELAAGGGSDLHLTAGVPPMIRLHGELIPLADQPKLTPRELRTLLYGILNQKQREVFENDLELDLSYQLPGTARFRVNIFQQRDSIGAVMRVIPSTIKTIQELGIPATIAQFAQLHRGFVLVTGPTGSGKSTTLAALIDGINRNRKAHIMTVEDPIEFLHEHRQSLVNQRELGTDTHSFAAALKHVLRQDPDVILVGELRDLETIQVALTAAETGHLVFATLHTQDAPQTVDRIVDVFPPHQQEQIRVMLSGALQGVVCQQLLKTIDGKGRIAATEVMVATPAIKNLIREGKTHQMYSALQAGKQFGMVTMDQSLADLVLAGKVAFDVAAEHCHALPEFKRLAGRA